MDEPLPPRRRRRGKVSLTGEDDRARVADLLERIGELADQRGVERVPALGSG